MRRLKSRPEETMKPDMPWYKVGILLQSNLKDLSWKDRFRYSVKSGVEESEWHKAY